MINEKENKVRGKVILITGVSGSGKSTIVAKLLKDYQLTQPLQFTTRLPRDDGELDNYCFLSEEQFFLKLKNGDFAEWTMYNGNLYGITSHLPSGDSIVIVEPVGASAMKKFLNIKGIPFISIFLDITPETMEERLGMMRRENIKFIEERKKDFLYFDSKGYTYEVDANGSFEETYRHISHICKMNYIQPR